MSDAPLLAEQDGAVRVLTINKPPFNPMGLAFMDALEAEVAAVASDDGTRAVLLTAAGGAHFSVGMNLKELGPGIEAKGGLEPLLDQRLRVLDAIETMGKPWVVTLFGFCLGGGLELPLACHLRIAAAEGAQIGLPELEIGAVPAWGGSARLVRTVGRTHALDIILRARKITGPEALAIGLATEVHPTEALTARGLALAQDLAAMPRLAVKGMLDCLVGYETKSLAQSIADERAAVMALQGSADQQEGIMAFLEKRAPVFNRGG